MADQCRNCGSELFYGQRFCRACGKTTDPIVEENAPTQRMPPPPDMWGARQANTAPTSGQDTSPVFTPPSYYQPQPPPLQPYTPPQPRSSWPWVVAIIGSGLLVAMILGVIFMSRTFRAGREMGERAAATRKGQGPSGQTPGTPPAPPELPELPELAPPPPPPPGAEAVLGADNAEVTMSGSETILTKTFTLDKTAMVTVSNTNGDISVESTDGPEAEMIVTKRGGSAQDREAAQVKFYTDNGRLSLKTELPRGGSNMSVHYELRLPRQLGRVDIRLTNGDIRMSDIAAQIAVSTTNGQIELSDVAGVGSAKTVSGNIEAHLTEMSDRPMEFKSVSGNIDIGFNSAVNADLTASTTSGSIRLDEDFGIAVQKPMVGQHASGRIGRGGPALSVKTVSGNIKITR